MRYIFLLVIIAASVGVFVAVIIPRYDIIKTEQAQVSTYTSNLATANQLQQSRQALIAQYNTISQSDLTNLTTLLPDSVDNIRLIIQINALATTNGLSSLRNIDYNASAVAADGTSTNTTGTNSTSSSTTSSAPDTTSDPNQALSPYGQFVMSFQTSGQYSNFLSFLSDLEQNLRLVDVSDIEFTPATSTGTTGTQTLASGMSYKVTLTTYWLKQ